MKPITTDSRRTLKMLAVTRLALVVIVVAAAFGMASSAVGYFGDDCPQEDESVSYGPCPCVPRKTLFQWSYGTSFSGGPNLDEPLVTDRPDFTEASVTVGRGV